MTVPRTCGATFAEAPKVATAVTQLLTIAPVPTGGTIEGLDIICGTKGSACSVSHPDGVPVELHPTADPGFTFMGFLGDCKPLGHTQMTGPRTCGATFSPTAVVSAVPPPKPSPSRPPVDRGPRETGPPSRPVDQTPSRPPVPVSPGNTVVAPPAPDKQVPPPPTDEEYAKSRIKDVLKDYCKAYEALDPAAVQRVFPKVDMATLQIQLNASKYRSVQCKFADPEFVALDAAAGTATVQAEVKRVFEHTAVESKPQTQETVAVMTMSRSSLRSPWYIDTVKYKSKAK